MTLVLVINLPDYLFSTTVLPVQEDSIYCECGCGQKFPRSETMQRTHHGRMVSYTETLSLKCYKELYPDGTH